MALRWRGGCKDGPCPNVYDYEPQSGMVAVQGDTVTDPDVLGEITVEDHESLILVPRDLLIAYARQILREEEQTLA